MHNHIICNLPRTIISALLVLLIPNTTANHAANNLQMTMNDVEDIHVK